MDTSDAKISVVHDGNGSSLIQARSTTQTNKAGTDWRTYGTLQVSWGKGVGAVTDVRVLGDATRQKIATRMYEIAAKLAEKRGVPLVSDTSRHPGAEGFWKKQVSKGRAKLVTLEPGQHPSRPHGGSVQVYQLHYPPPPTLESQMRLWRLSQALAEAVRDSREEQERSLIAKRYPKNPFVYQSRMTPVDFTIGFKTMNNSTDPLWWTGSGFKDLGRVRSEPESFKTKAEAEHKIKSELLDFIRKNRGDQEHLIIGW